MQKILKLEVVGTTSRVMRAIARSNEPIAEQDLWATLGFIGDVHLRHLLDTLHDLGMVERHALFRKWHLTPAGKAALEK